MLRRFYYRHAMPAVLLSWFFIVLNGTLDPQFEPRNFKSQADCDTARAWLVKAHFKGAVPDQATQDQYISPCFQEFTVLQ
jgi:hypothetical protein